MIEYTIKVMVKENIKHSNAQFAKNSKEDIIKKNLEKKVNLYQ